MQQVFKEEHHQVTKMTFSLLTGEGKAAFPKDYANWKGHHVFCHCHYKVKYTIIFSS